MFAVFFYIKKTSKLISNRLFSTLVLSPAQLHPL